MIAPTASGGIGIDVIAAVTGSDSVARGGTKKSLFIALELWPLLAVDTVAVAGKRERKTKRCARDADVDATSGKHRNSPTMPSSAPPLPIPRRRNGAANKNRARSR